jgi:hypothetical protein
MGGTSAQSATCQVSLPGLTPEEIKLVEDAAK